MELQASRLRARTAADGRPVLLPDQDRRRWDPLLIRRGLEALEQAEALGGVLGPYALQAAIAACHARAAHAEQTDWARITALYDALMTVAPTPVVALNRAVAVAMAFGPEAGLPLVVDNTSATPYLCRPIDHGATLVVHSTTKYLTGNGTVTGGCIVDSGKFDWSASDKFPSLSQPEPAYHGLKFHETFGPLAFTFHGIAIGLRDLGMTMNPQAAHYTLMGIETLSLRMARHVENAVTVASWLEKDPRVAYVTYAGLESSPYHDRIARICPKGAGGLFTFALKAGYEACVKFVDSVEIFSHVANLGDTRSLVIHSASTTHRQLSPEQQKAAGAAPEVVRVSIGIEDPADLIADLDQALTKACG